MPDTTDYYQEGKDILARRKVLCELVRGRSGPQVQKLREELAELDDYLARVCE